MVASAKSQAAQYLYLAQLDAQKGSCNCKACQLLRKSNDAMVTDALAPAADPQGVALAAAAKAAAGGDETGE
jgi:hypothetical protein